MIQKLTSGDYAVSAWSGGTTTQLAIYPENAVYADRDFLWRVSSATVDLEDSDFTPLPDYDRLIATLEGEIVLTHNGGAPLRLRPLEVHAFSGADATHSVGRCRDFNLMLRRGRASGTMEALHLAGAAKTSHAKGRGSAVNGTEEECCPLAAEESVLSCFHRRDKHCLSAPRRNPPALLRSRILHRRGHSPPRRRDPPLHRPHPPDPHRRRGPDALPDHGIVIIYPIKKSSLDVHVFFKHESGLLTCYFAQDYHSDTTNNLCLRCIGRTA